MPSIQKNSFLLDQSVITLGDQKIIIDFYNTPLGERFLEAIQNKCLLYTSPSPRDRQKCRMPA